MAWLAAVYLTYQLISIPFGLPAGGNRFMGVVDGMASLVPLAVVLIVVFGKPQLLGTPQRWEAAFLLIFITIVDLFGGYTFNIALSRRTMDVAPVAPVEHRRAGAGRILGAAASRRIPLASRHRGLLAAGAERLVFAFP